MRAGRGAVEADGPGPKNAGRKNAVPKNAGPKNRSQRLVVTFLRLVTREVLLMLAK